MRQIIQLTLLLIAFACAIPQTAFAQRESSDQSSERSLANRLWYGTGGTLGFSSNNQQSIFQIGITPMVGYKLNDFLSLGPRLSVVYSSRKYNFGGGQVLRANPVEFGYGAFLRSRIYSGLFAQGEYERYSYGDVVYNGVDLDVRRRTRNNTYLGLGWNAGRGAVGSEIMLLYNFNIPNNSVESELSLRAGLTWRF